ncbi:MAG: hypothetical protein AAF591_23640 [Verrucomicrobiota bacterium]
MKGAMKIDREWNRVWCQGNEAPEPRAWYLVGSGVLPVLWERLPAY